MTLPTLSVVMAVQNGHPYLKAAVESILTQSFMDFEFIVVDDHSTDGTLDYLNALQDPRLRIMQATKKGQTPALNQGLRAARADWIVRMDGDDWCFPERLERQWAVAQESAGVVLITSDYELCDEDLRPTAAIRLQRNAKAVLHYLHHKNNPFCHPTVMFHRVTAESVGYFDETLRNAQDYGLWRRLLEHGQWTHVSQLLLRYRVRRGSLSILRQPEQTQERLSVLQGRSSGNELSRDQAQASPKSVEGLYRYRLAFGAWLDGRRGLCLKNALIALRFGVRPARALTMLATLWLPRRLYLRCTGYGKIYV